MRLLFFMQTASPIGGVETWLDRACDHLAGKGFDPVVALARGLKYNSPERYRQHHPELPTIEVDGRGLNREGRIRALMRCIVQVKPDIVLPLGIVDANEAVIRCKLAGRRVRLLGRAQGNLLPMLADLRLYRDWFDHVVCPGKLTRRMLIEWAEFPPHRISNISNGADEPVVQHLPPRQDAVLRIGYVGRLSQPDKRVLDLIPFCQELDGLGVPYQLDIVGDGPAGPELQDGLAKFASKVKMHGALTHSELYRKVFPRLDVLLMTSASEAFGTVLVEAMMHGVVPISSRYHGFHCEALVQEGVTGLSFEVGDMAAAARAAGRLQSRPDMLSSLSEGASAHGMRYSWSRSFEAWERVLRKVSAEQVLVASTPPHGMPVERPGRLERFGMPPAVIDGLRRLRRSLLGPAVQPGGEEWPLFHRIHSAEHLECVGRALMAIDRPPTSLPEATL